MWGAVSGGVHVMAGKEKKGDEFGREEREKKKQAGISPYVYADEWKYCCSAKQQQKMNRQGPLGLLRSFYIF